MLYIFLDIDGVLNKESDWKNKYYLDRNCVAVLSEICTKLKKEYENIRVILCSTWRAGFSKAGNDTKQIENLEIVLAQEGISIYDKTPISNKGRQAEIEYYIKRNHVKKYLVLDDDLSLFRNPDELPIYVPNYKTGLVMRDVKEILKIVRRLQL